MLPFIRLVSLVGFALALGFAAQCPEKAAAEMAFAAAPDSPIEFGANVARLALADFDRDGVLDLAVACGRPADAQDGVHSQVVILIGDGHGSFRPTGTLEVRKGASDLAIGDIDGDGAPDIAIAHHDHYEVELFLGDGKGGFERSAETPLCGSGRKAHTHELALADVDRDGDLDLLANNADDSAIGILLNDGAGHFAARDAGGVPAGRHPYDSMSFARIDGDSITDVVVPDLMGASIVVLLGDGRGSFAPAASSPFAVGTRPGFANVGDVDGDGDADIVSTHDDDPLVAVLLGDGKGAFAHAPGSPMHLEHTVWGSALGDLDRDGDADVCLGTYTGAGLRIFTGERDGSLLEAACSPLRTRQNCGHPALGDLDRDGRLDLVVADDDGGCVFVFLQREPAAAK